MFYDKFVRLANSVGKTPSAVALECGLTKPTVTKWKQGGSPTDATARKIADYFNVPVDYLLTDSEQKETAPTSVEADAELMEILEELATRPEKKTFFSLTKGASKEDVEMALRMVDAFLNSKEK